jgi:hypothetical protein
MTLWPNPKRLSEPGSDAPEILRKALQQARASRVADQSVRRVADKLLPIVASGAATQLTADSLTGAYSAGKLSLFSKTIGYVAFTGVLSTVLYLNYQPVPRQSAAIRVTERAVPSAPRTDSNLLDPLVITVAATERVETTPFPDAGVPANKSSRPPRAPRTVAKAQPLTLRPPDPASELALLQRAQLALDTQPKQTMTLVSEHEREYLHGIFAQEREILAVEALTKLGKRESARQRGERFLREYPESAHVRRIYNLMKQYPPQSPNRENNH